MAKVYLSSTYADLVEYREAAYRALRALRQDVIAMEDYVARDERPAEQCIADVQACQLYVGVLGLRYGFVPPADNAEKYSITEMEYRAARSKNIPCLMFLAEENSWPLGKTDFKSGDNGAGARIMGFRASVGESNLRGQFTTKEDLAQKVTAAVATWEREQAGAGQVEPRPAAAVAMQRLITTDLLLAGTALEQDVLEQTSVALSSQALRIAQRTDALLADTDVDFEQLDSIVSVCHAAAVVLTPQSLAGLAGRKENVARVINLMAERCGGCVALLHGVVAADLPPEWHFAGLVDMPSVGASGAVAALRAVAPSLGQRSIQGLPFIVCAMTRAEADELVTPGQSPLAPFQNIWAADPEARTRWLESYGPTRLTWRPFGGQKSVQDVAFETVGRLGETSPAQRRRLKLQYYPLDPLLEDPPRLRLLYQQVADSGCIVIVDEMSLLHPRLAHVAGGLVGGPQVSIVTLAPFDNSDQPPGKLLWATVREKLSGAFDRFEIDYDPRCDFGIDDHVRLRRWLHASLPEAARNLRQPPPSRSKLDEFKQQMGHEERGISGLIGGQGGDQ